MQKRHRSESLCGYLRIRFGMEETVPRKGHIPKRDVLADPIYNDKVVTKLINNIMLDGKKGVAQKIVYGAFAKVEEKSGKPALEVFQAAMNNIMPILEVKARRIGGATYQVPIEVRPDRRQALALRWMTMFSRKKRREDHGGPSGRGDHGRRGQYRRQREEKRGDAQDGGCQQGLRSLQILMRYRR